MAHNLALPEETKAGFAPINGIDLYFETTGRGQPLLLLHAGVADSRMWDNQFKLFSQTYQVIRCDLRGFGQSGKAAGLFAHYEDMAGLLNYLNIEAVSLIGASFGGAVALDFVLAYPEMVTALILVAPALGGYEFESAEMLDFFAAEEAAIERGDLTAATELNLKMWVDGFQRSEVEVSGQVREQVRRMQLNIFAQPDVVGIEAKELIPPAIDQLDRINVPTLVIVGDKDVAEFQSLSRLIAEKIKNGRQVIMPGTAHLPSMEKPEEFNRIVLEFLG